MKHESLAPFVAKYILGFASALILSTLAYLIVVQEWFATPGMTMAILLLLAVVQLVVQLVCFLHLDFKDRSRDRTTVIIFTLIMMLVIVIGSLWVMHNLDYRMGMSPEAMNEYMIEQNKKGF